MAVGFSVGFFWYQIGSGDFLHSFFSTVAYNLERKRWGSNYPVVMNELYQGKLEIDKIDNAINEVKDIQVQLRKYAPNQVVWDMDDLSKQPPWGTNISTEITDLSNYFVTSDGEDFITILLHALEKAKEMNVCIEIESI